MSIPSQQPWVSPQCLQQHCLTVNGCRYLCSWNFLPGINNTTTATTSKPHSCSFGVSNALFAYHLCDLCAICILIGPDEVCQFAVAFPAVVLGMNVLALCWQLYGNGGSLIVLRVVCLLMCGGMI